MTSIRVGRFFVWWEHAVDGDHGARRRNYQVIRITDKVDLVMAWPDRRPDGGFQPIEGHLGQQGRGDAPLRCARLGRKEPTVFQVTGAFLSAQVSAIGLRAKA